MLTIADGGGRGGPGTPDFGWRNMWTAPNEYQSQKVAGDEIASSLYHSGHLYGPGTLIGIDFHPETAEK